MSLDLRVYLLVTIGAAGLALLVRSDRRISAAVALIGLAASSVIAFLIADGPVLGLAEGAPGGSAFVRLFLGLAGGSSLAVSLAALGLGQIRRLPLVSLAWLPACALALVLPSTPSALLAATAGASIALVGLTDVRQGVANRTVGTYLLVLAVGATFALAGAAWLTDASGPLAFDPVAGGAAALAMGLALALRLGALPFHVPTARLVRALIPMGIPMLLGWLGALFFLVALTWSQRLLQPQPVDLGVVPGLIAAVGSLSLLAGAIGTIGRPSESDDLEHIVSYGVVQDAGLFLVAFAALDVSIWEPARAWALYFAVSRTALAAWMAILVAVRGSSRVGALDGWAREMPLLVLALLGALAAGLGLPGLGSWDARQAIVESVGEPLLRWAAYAGWALAYLPFVRLLWVGLRRPAEALPEVARPRLRFPATRPERRDARLLTAYALETARLSRVAIAVALVCLIGVGAAGLAIAPGVLTEAAATLPEPLLPNPPNGS